MLKKILIGIVIIVAAIVIIGAIILNNDKYNYGVFIGADPSEAEKLGKYKEVIIDATYFTEEDIDIIHKKGTKVYSYINVGSIEEFRNHYKDFVHLAICDYENWENEKWIDVSNEQWQTYFVHTIAKDLLDKGIDGLFIDNVDVYSLSHDENIYNGLMNILKDISNKYDKPVIINGGYDFIEKAISQGEDIQSIVAGINLEEVSTIIEDYDNNIFKKQSEEDKNYVIEYLEKIRDRGMDVYIIEYSKNKLFDIRLKSEYNSLKFKLFISEKVNL
ncbi:endo alpha-1,4 polygalactosaminidase [Clostridium sediminicola]|uniref:endo alpha-1,4 polygalactosaminidase n=1 Tax=Clostridium sediminicola TaxID=3114879 RepID=UPI0031F21839